MKIGFVGLGKMGMQMTTRLIKGGHEVVAMDVAPAAVAQAKSLGATAVASREELLNALGTGQPAVVWLMIPSHIVEAEVDAWLDLLPAGSIIVDGGNSDFRDTIKRGARALAKDIAIVDVGTSGGILGLENGFSMMVGGTPEAVEVVRPVIMSLAQKDGWDHFGPVGSGHYIKMIHNGIEYGLMESYAEGFRLLHDGPVVGIDLGKVAGVWQNGSIIASGLNGLAALVLTANPALDGIDGYVAENGEAAWTLETAAAAGVDVPAIQTAVNVRHASQAGTVHFGTKLLAALRNAFGGHAVNK